MKVQDALKNITVVIEAALMNGPERDALRQSVAIVAQRCKLADELAKEKADELAEAEAKAEAKAKAKAEAEAKKKETGKHGNKISTKRNK